MRIATKLFGILFVSFLLVFVVKPLQAANDDRYIRVASVQGDVTLHSADGQRPGDMTVNTPVTDGDEIETNEGRVELSFNNGIMARIGDNSTVHIDSAYSPMRIELVQGTLFVDSHLVDSFRDELEVLAGDAQVYLIDEGNLRVDMGSEGSVRVTSIQGEAEVRANGRRVLLENGERTYIDPGNDPEKPVAFNGQFDDLDDWNQSQMDRYASNNNYDRGGDEYLDDNLRYDAQDLDNYGDWRDYDNYGHVWVPRVGSDWRPYYDGRWLYTNDDWFWVSYEPWGWAPYHYGRWGWGYDIGWYWIPGAAFAPAWVSWYDYGDYIGWCPLNFYNRPIWFNFYYNNYHNLPRVQKQKTLDAGNSWTFVKKNDLGSGNIKRIVTPPSEIRKIHFDEHRLTRTPERRLVNYVIPKTQVSPGYVNDKRMLKSPGDIRNPLGVDHRKDNVSPGRVDTGKDRSDDKKRVAPADRNNNRDREFQHGTVRTMPETRRQDNGNRPVHNNDGSNRMNDRNPYIDRDSQFLRGDDNRHSRSFISPYYRDRYENQRNIENRGSENRDRQQYIPYYRNFGSDRNNNDNDNRDISPRYGDEARRMFERFDAERQNNSRDNNNGRDMHQPDRYQRPPDPPRHDSRPSTPPPQQRENHGSSNNHGGGQRPPDKHH